MADAYIRHMNQSSFYRDFTYLYFVLFKYKNNIILVAKRNTMWKHI